jgi:hypothetical protein
MPAQVPIDARKWSKGVGAEPSPPYFMGWSVGMTVPSISALTFFPPGNVILISMVSLLSTLRYCNLIT